MPSMCKVTVSNTDTSPILEYSILEYFDLIHRMRVSSPKIFHRTIFSLGRVAESKPRSMSDTKLLLPKKHKW